MLCRLSSASHELQDHAKLNVANLAQNGMPYLTRLVVPRCRSVRLVGACKEQIVCSFESSRKIQRRCARSLNGLTST